MAMCGGMISIGQELTSGEKSFCKSVIGVVSDKDLASSVINSKVDKLGVYKGNNKVLAQKGS